MIFSLLLAICKAQTNLSDETVEKYYNQPFEFFFTPEGWITFKQPKIVFAKFKMVENYFMPELDHCFFNDIMLNLDTAKIELETEKDNTRKARRKTAILAGVAGAGGVVLGILAGRASCLVRLK